MELDNVTESSMKILNVEFSSVNPQQAEGEDELKKRQLMELAIINGTYRDNNAKVLAAAGEKTNLQDFYSYRKQKRPCLLLLIPYFTFLTLQFEQWKCVRCSLLAKNCTHIYFDFKPGIYELFH
jgi:hypothetical protein